jgi:hypothetical protein
VLVSCLCDRACWGRALQEPTGEGIVEGKDSWDQFSIDPRLLPAAVPLRVAEKALFSGKAAIVLKSMVNMPGEVAGAYFYLELNLRTY